MKNISGQKIFKYGTLLLISILAINHYAHVWYGPVSDKETGFPLQLVWETKLNDKIKEVYITENGNILVQLGYSVNLISPKSGKLLWKFRTDKSIYSAASGDEKVYIFGDNSFIIVNEVNGKSSLEDYDNYSVNIPIDSYTNKNQILVTDYGSVSFYEIESGKFLYEHYVGRGRVGICLYSEFLYTFNNQIDVFSLKDAKHLWGENSFGYVDDNVCDGSSAYFIASDSKLVAYDLEARTKLWVKDFPVKDPYTLERVFSVDGLLIVEGINNIFIISKADGSVIHILSIQDNLTKDSLISSVAKINNNLYLFDGYSQSIYSFDINTWKQTGSLHLSFPNIISTENERFININDMLILWKNNRLFAYK